MTIPVRALSPEETGQLTDLARSRKRGAGLVRCARIILHAAEEHLSAADRRSHGAVQRDRPACRREAEAAPLRRRRVPAQALRCARPQWIGRGYALGAAAAYSAAETGMIIGAVLTCPAELGLPFACWTLDRMVAHVSEQGIGMRRSRLGEILCDEGLQ